MARSRIPRAPEPRASDGPDAVITFDEKAATLTAHSPAAVAWAKGHQRAATSALLRQRVGGVAAAMARAGLRVQIEEKVVDT